MNRSSDSDSEEDVKDGFERRLTSLVLRPAITSLPSIGDDPESEDGSSSSEAEVVFSNINWTAEESTSFDLALASPGPATDTSGKGSRTATESPGPGVSRSDVERATHAFAPSKLPQSDLPDESRTARRPLSSPAATTRADGATTVTAAAAAVEVPAIWAGAGDGPEDIDGDSDGSYEGRGWLAGAAGRLANVTERRRYRRADASDEEHVAAAARDAAALQLLLQDIRAQQEQQLRQQQHQEQQASLTRLATLGAVAGSSDDAGARRLREQQEQRISQDFHDAIRAAESEPPVLASASFSLEATAAGLLGMDDLDALIARLSQGAADLHAPGAAAATTAAVGAAAGAASEAVSAAAAISNAGEGPTGMQGPVSGRSAGTLWSLDLPAADSLWSDEEVEAATASEPMLQAGGSHQASAAAPAAGAGSGAPAAAGSATADELAGAGMGLQGEAAMQSPHRPLEGSGGDVWPPEVPSGASSAVSAALTMSAAAAPAGDGAGLARGSASAQQAAAGTPPQPQVPPSQPLPAKFKFFAGPGSLPAAPPAAPAQPRTQPDDSGGAAASAGSSGSGGPIKLDLRQSIAAAVQRSSQELAAAAAQRESQAKAAAARRRMAAAGSDSEADEDDEEDGGAPGGDKQKERPGAAPRQRPVPPAPPPTGQPQTPAAAATEPTAQARPAPGRTEPAAVRPEPTPSSTATPTQQQAAPRRNRVGFTDSSVTHHNVSATATIASRDSDDAAAAVTGVRPADAAAAAAAAAAGGGSSRPMRMVATAGGSAGSAASIAPASAAPAACASVGTDVADLRPPSRSTFVSTTERDEDEEERTRDIREYLKARAAAKAAAVAASAAAPTASGNEDVGAAGYGAVREEQRRWPDPPEAVAQRIADLAGRAAPGASSSASAASVVAAGVAAAGLAVPGARSSANFSGGTGATVRDLENGIGPKDAHAVSASAVNATTNATSTSNTASTSTAISTSAAHTATTSAAATSAATAATAPSAPAPAAPVSAISDATTTAMTTATAAAVDATDATTTDSDTAQGDGPGLRFAACSTEGDEDLVAEPAASTVVDASRERGSRLAAAGTFIHLTTPATQTPSAAPGAAAAAGVVGVPKGPAQLPSQAAPAATAGPVPTARTQPPATAPAKTAPVPTATAVVRPLTSRNASASTAVTTSTTSAATTSSSAAPDAKKAAGAKAPMTLSPTAAAPSSKAPASAAPADLCRLPAWLPPSSCFTLLLTSPANLTTLETGALLAWMLRCSSTASASASGAGPAPPPFTVVGLRLLGVSHAWPLLPAAAGKHFNPSTTTVPANSTTGYAGGASGAPVGAEVRVLAVACLPRAGVDPDAYGHELPAAAAANAAAANAAAKHMEAALAAVHWSAALAGAPATDGAGCPLECEQACHAPAPGTGLAAEGTLSGWVACHPGAEHLFSPLHLQPHALSHHHPRTSTSGGPAATAPPSPSATSAASGAAGAFACVVTRGSLQHPDLLRGILSRAARSGLTLVGLQVVYGTDEAAAAVVAATPHRPLPYVGAAVLALAGRNEPLRRWQAQLGPPDARLAARTDPGSLHALYGDAARLITCSYDSATAAREASALLLGGSGGGVGGGSGPASVDVHGAPWSSVSPSSLSAASPSPPGVASAAQGGRLSKAGQLGGCMADGAPNAVSGLASPGAPHACWLALPAHGAAQQALGLWAVQHLVWCGFSLRSMVMMSLPAALVLRLPPPPDGHDGVSAALVLELSKEEAVEGLGLALASLPRPPRAAAPPAALSSTPTAPAAAPVPAGPLSLPSLVPSNLLASHIPPADVLTLPPPHVAEQLLAAAAGAAAATRTPGGGGRGDAGGGDSASQQQQYLPPQPLGLHHHGEDGLAVVALQSRPLHAAALLLSMLALHATPAAAQLQGQPAGQQIPDETCGLPGPGHGVCIPRRHQQTAGAAAAAAAAGGLSETAGGLTASYSSSAAGSHGLELVACRYLRQVPSDVASCLAVLQPGHGHSGGGVSGGGGASGAGGVSSTGGLRPPHRLVISQPALLAVFHGPSAQQRVAELLGAALQRLQEISAGGAHAATAAEGIDAATWSNLVGGCLRDLYPTAASAAPSMVAATGAAASAPPGPPQVVVAISASQASAKRALAHAFAPAQVFLDAGIHDGMHRPPLPERPMALPAAAAAASASPALSALGWLLSGPEVLPAVVAVDFGALQRNVLPRLLKQLWREGYVLHAAATTVVRAGGAAAAAMPGLAGRPAVLLHVSRSNAVLHLRSLAAALAAMSGGTAPGGGGSGGLHTCATWREVTAVVAEVWRRSDGSGAGADGSVLWHGETAAAGVPPRRVVRPEGSRLLQLTAMVVTPSAAGAGDGGPPSLDWPRLADALEALHAEGFRLAALRAAAVTPRDLADLARVSCRISAAQQHAIHAATVAATSPDAAAMEPPAASVPPPAPCNLVVLALARDSAVTSLQIMVDEAARLAGPVRAGPGLPGSGPGSRSVVPAPPAVSGSLGRREAVAALAGLAACVSVSHSPAAAEQQVVALFEGAFGPGGVALVQ